MPPETADLSVSQRLERAIAFRAERLDAAHESACRLFNGFTEGMPSLAIDLYARTALIHDYSREPDGEGAARAMAEVVATLRNALPWLGACVRKARSSQSPQSRRGTLLFGDAPDTRVREHGVLYAIDPTLNRDAGLYLDTRDLREWARANLAGKSVLNTFAYTCSLGVAAMSAGASRVVNTDRTARFLEVGRASYALNKFTVRKADFRVGDFFAVASELNRANARFDCVFLDPPFFASGDKGVVDLQSNTERLINKLRPLVAHDGRLVVVNNAVFVSGQEFVTQLEALCASGYLAIESFVTVPDDFLGAPSLRGPISGADPAPFVHSTKIAVLRVRRKSA